MESGIRGPKPPLRCPMGAGTLHTCIYTYGCRSLWTAACYNYDRSRWVCLEDSRTRTREQDSTSLSLIGLESRFTSDKTGLLSQNNSRFESHSFSFAFSEIASGGVSDPSPSVITATLLGFPLPMSSAKIALNVRTLVFRPSQSGYNPTHTAEQNIHKMPTTTHPVKNFLLKMYPLPYIGIGQRIRKAMVMKSVNHRAMRAAL
jgi:hypothetical protein